MGRARARRARQRQAAGVWWGEFRRLSRDPARLLSDVLRGNNKSAVFVYRILTRRYPQDTAGVLRYKWPQDAAVSSGRACFRVVFGRSYGGVIRYRTSGSRWSRDRPAGQDNECGRAEPPLAAGTGVERYCPPTRVSSRVHSARADGRASTRHLHGKTEHLIGTHTARVPAWTPLTAGARRCAGG